MANGDLIKLGTLYLGGAKKARPTNPINGGDIPAFSAGQVIEIRDTDTSDAYKLQWREINDGGKKYLVADRAIIQSISWDDLNGQSLIFGKTIIIDGQQYKIRSLTGGSNYRGTDAYSGGSPTSNEWDRWIVNEAGLVGLPTPTATELTNNSANQNGTHNQFWNWYNMYSWAQETYTANGSRRAIRGRSSARFWNYYASSSRDTVFGFRPVLEVLNSTPTVTLNTANNTTLYENSTYTIDGQAIDTDNGNIVNVKYSIDGIVTKALVASVSNGTTPLTFNKQLTFKNGKLFDGETSLTGDLAEGTAHQLKVWAEDDQGGKSADQIRSFYVVPNRAPSLTINAPQPSGTINSDKFTISGTCSDIDGNDVVVTYRINSGLSTEIYRGAGADFAFDVSLGELNVGNNAIVVEVADTYGFKTSKTVKLNKSEIDAPLLSSTARYQVLPPKGSAKGIVLWVQHQTELNVDASISAVLAGEQEQFVAMTKTNTAPVDANTVEDEFTFESSDAKEDITIKLDLTRESADVSDAITLITGVLS